MQLQVQVAQLREQVLQRRQQVVHISVHMAVLRENMYCVCSHTAAATVRGDSVKHTPGFTGHEPYSIVSHACRLPCCRDAAVSFFHFFEGWFFPYGAISLQGALSTALKWQGCVWKRRGTGRTRCVAE